MVRECRKLTTVHFVLSLELCACDPTTRQPYRMETPVVEVRTSSSPRKVPEPFMLDESLPAGSEYSVRYSEPIKMHETGH